MVRAVPGRGGDGDRGRGEKNEMCAFCVYAKGQEDAKVLRVRHGGKETAGVYVHLLLAGGAGSNLA